MKRFYKRRLPIKALVIMAAQLGFVLVSAQNLVQNPGFEEFQECPSEYGCLERVVPFWHQPTNGSTDYFNACSPTMSSEDNFMGLQSPHEGKAYAGMYMYAPKDYREYLTAELSEPLKDGQKYTFSFQVSLAEESPYGLNEFGVLFTNKTLEFNTSKNIQMNLKDQRKHQNYKIVRNHKYFKDKEKWVEVAGVYVASGTERFMTIGNFNTNSNTRLVKIGGNLKKLAYYYVDMVVVNKLKGDYKLDEVYVFENLNFDTNGYTITNDDKTQLNELLDYLKAHSGYNVSIYGHTDNIGSKEYNKDLSQKRARAVAHFLIANGLETNRILWRGYGALNPLKKNATSEGRGKNRRVEFVLSRKKNIYYGSEVYKED